MRLRPFFLKQFLLLLLMLFSLAPAISQTPFFKQFNPNRDNVNLKTNVIYQDLNGYLWIGTSEGAYKYNGNEYVLYKLPKETINDDVTAIFQDQSKTIWIGYYNGAIATIKNGVIAIFDIEEGLPKKPITSILQDKNGTIWFTTAGEGVYYFLGNRLYNINLDDGLNDNYVYTIIEDKAGKIWVGTDQGIAFCSTVKNQKVTGSLKLINGLPDEIVRTLKCDSKGNIWIGMQDKGICKFDFLKNKIETTYNLSSWKYGQVNDLLVSDNEIWIATEENGIVNYSFTNKGIPKAYTTYGNLKFPKVNKIVQDDEGNIWMSTNNGIIRSHGNWLTFLSEIKNKKINFVHSIYCDSKNNLIFTPDQGLIITSLNNNDTTLKSFTLTPVKNLIDIISIYEDTFGFYWIGTMGEGIFRLNAETGERIKIPGIGIENQNVLTIAGSGNTIWLGTFGGALKLHIKNGADFKKTEFQFQNFEGKKVLGNYFIYSIFIDSKKRVWFGTDQKGITYLDNETFYSFDEKNGLRGNTVLDIVEDDNAQIWFSVQNGGLGMYDGKQIKNYGSEQGLRDLNVTALATSKDKIIMIHRRGIDVLHIQSGKIDYYGTENNLADISPDINSVAKDKEGRIWFGTEKGIVIFNPNLENEPSGPKIVLNSVTLYELDKNVTGIHDFSYNQNDIAFEYSGLWFTDPDRLKYQYKLENFNNNWIDTRDKRIIFTSLPPGKYTFRVRASLNKNFIINDVVSYNFTISKPFWDEFWFRFAALMVLLSLIFLYVKQRDKHTQLLERLKKEKIEFQFETLKSQVNPHFLFNSFNTLIAFIEKDKNIAVEYVENLSEYFRNLINYRDKDLITVEEELKLSYSYYFLQQKRFGSNLSIIIDIDKSKNNLLVPPLVVQILLENAIKHNAISIETPLIISITTVSEKLVIKNNINPKYTTEKSTGTGIKNVINRYELLTKEKVDIEKTDTDFIVSIPLINTI